MKRQHDRTPSLSISRAESPSISPSLESTPPESVLNSIAHHGTSLHPDDTLPSSMLGTSDQLDGLI